MGKILTATDVIDNDKYMQEQWEKARQQAARHLYPFLEVMADILYKIMTEGGRK